MSTLACDPWDSLYESELQHASQRLQDEAEVIDEAERVRTESASEDDSDTHGGKVTLWWAQLLESRMKDLGHDLKL